MTSTDKPVLLLLPGLLCDATVWEPQIRDLADACEPRVPVYADCTSLADMARVALAGAPPGRFAVAGHSLGGRVAFELLRLAQDRVSHLALLDTAPDPLAEGEPAKRQVLVDLARREGMAALARVWLADMVHPDRLRDAAFMAALYRMVERHSLLQYTGQITALLNRADATPLLGQIRCPTLVLCGRQDTWRTAEQHQEMAAAIRGVDLEIIEDCGHMATLEKPAQVSAALRRLLARAA